jgi:hypothetical protein
MQEGMEGVILIDGNKDLKELSDMIKSKAIEHMSKEG